MILKALEDEKMSEIKIVVCDDDSRQVKTIVKFIHDYKISQKYAITSSNKP